MELPPQTLSFAAEACWNTGKWQILDQFLKSGPGAKSQDFNVGIGRALSAMQWQDKDIFHQTISGLRIDITRGLSVSTTASLAAAHPQIIKLHALYELELISGMAKLNLEPNVLMDTLDRRLDILGAYTEGKQYLLGLRRAAMGLSKLVSWHPMHLIMN
jgi:serine/threonine-protein kinase ATR